MKKKILVVEDDDVTRTVLTTVLKSEYEVDEAHDAENALLKFEGCDLIICDYHMPGMSGLDFARKTRSKNIPFVMLTVENDPQERAEAKAIGITAWQTKPFAPDFILSRVKMIFDKIEKDAKEKHS